MSQGLGRLGFASYSARLGEALFGPSVCLVLCDTVVFYRDAKAEDGRAWIGGFFEISPGCQGPWFSLEVEKDWAP